MSTFLALIGPESAGFTPAAATCSVDEPSCRFFTKAGGLNSNVSVANTRDVAVIADASLYYREDLLRRLGKTSDRSSEATDAELIAASWLRWKEGCVDRLEGDWSFVLYDRRTATYRSARDPHGSRSLFWSMLGTTYAVASEAALVVSLDPGRFKISRQGVIRTLCLWDGDGAWTVWTGLHELPAGHLLTGGDTSQPHVRRFWTIQADVTAGSQTRLQAADHLRALLTDACRERLSRDARTAVSMSGGWDSTAIYGALRKSMSDAKEDPRLLQVVSLKYPKGDPGNEDEYVKEVLRYWDDAAIWPDTDRIPLVGRGFYEATQGPLPRLHHFHGINSAMARAAADTGASVLLGGAAGDLLFDISEAFMVELFGTFRWLRLRREWGARGLSGWENFKELVLRPSIPPPLLALKAHLLGQRRIIHPLSAVRAPWVPESVWEDPEIVAEERKVALERREFTRTYVGTSPTDHARTLGFLHPVSHRTYSDLRRDALSETIDFRQPFLDNRLIAFALARPWSDMVRDGETKVLLRESMRGILPAKVLAPRPSRTGTTSAYFYRKFRTELASLSQERPTPSPLVDMDIIRPEPLEARINQILITGSGPAGWIYRTLFLERWLANC